MQTTHRYDAVAFLEAVTAPTADESPYPSPLPSPTCTRIIVAARGINPEDLPSDWRIEFEERAALREYDGGQAREHAEAKALREILDRMRTAGEISGET